MEAKEHNSLGRLGEEYEANDSREIKVIFLAAFFAINVACLLTLIIYAIFHQR